MVWLRDSDPPCVTLKPAMSLITFQLLRDIEHGRESRHPTRARCICIQGPGTTQSSLSSSHKVLLRRDFMYEVIGVAFRA